MHGHYWEGVWCLNDEIGGKSYDTAEILHFCTVGDGPLYVLLLPSSRSKPRIVKPSQRTVSVRDDLENFFCKIDFFF